MPRVKETDMAVIQKKIDEYEAMLKKLIEKVQTQHKTIQEHKKRELLMNKKVLELKEQVEQFVDVCETAMGVKLRPEKVKLKPNLKIVPKDEE